MSMCDRAAISLAQESTRTIPAAFGELKIGEEPGWCRVSRPDRQWMVNPACRGSSQRARSKYFGELTRSGGQGRIAQSKAPRVGHRAQRGRLVMEWATEKHFVHESDFFVTGAIRPSTLTDRCTVRTDTPRQHPILDPKTSTVTFFKMPVADPNAAGVVGPPLHPMPRLSRSAPRPIG